MKKFGFSKKDKEGGGSPASSANPYAVNQPSNDAYASPPPYSGGNDRYRAEKTPAVTNDRYGSTGGGYGQGGYSGTSRYGSGPDGDDAQSQTGSRYGSGGYGGLGAAPSAGNNRYGGLPSGPAPAPAGLPSGPAPTGDRNRFQGGNEPPSASRYGGGGGGASRYGGGGGEPQPGSRYGGGAGEPQPGSRYGGGGGEPGNRYGGGSDPQGGNRYGGGASYGAAGGYGNPAGPGGESGNRYGNQAYAARQDEERQQSEWESGRGTGEAQGYGVAYQDRQLTAEEQEEEDVQGLKNEIRAIKQQDNSTRNALRIAQMSEETGRATLERLQQQGERIHNTERNLDQASNQNRLAAERAREIKTLNRSMFAVHVKNPFTSKQRIAEREEEVLRLAQEDREKRDATRAAAWGTQDRATRLQMDMNKGSGSKGGKASLAERAKYQFEADSEDEDMENEIDNNIDLLAGAAGRMKIIAGAMGSEIESQNKHIDRIGGKVDRVDDEIALNRSRLDRIK